MNKGPAEESDSEFEPGFSGSFHTVVQPHRDLETNWAVDLAKNLEDYLLKICSGEIGSSSQGGHDVPQLSVNFAEAALLLQGSVQVYSRKVEYLYSLVLHTLEFISRKSSQEQATGASSSTQEGSVLQTHDEEKDTFWGLDDIPAEAKNSLDGESAKDGVNYWTRPPANLVVLEGDCLDAIGDAGELESYLLATSDIFRDFVLLDSCDAVAVDEFLNSQSKSGKQHSDARHGNSLDSKGHKSFLSPTARSGSTGHKLSDQKKLLADIDQSPENNHGFQANDCRVGYSPLSCDFPDNENGHLEEHNGISDDSDCDDPWKPLNPHEPGSLKVKPFKIGKVTTRRDHSRKRSSLLTEFPVARLDGPISTELIEIWEAKCFISQRRDQPQSPLLYDKLRESLVHGSKPGFNAFSSSGANNMDNGYDSEDPGADLPDFDMPENKYAHEDVPLHNKDESNIPLNDDEEYEGPSSHENLEDLCRSHLDSLLATLAETEKQTESVTRVSTWKQRIEVNLEKEDSRPPFDMHKYGEKVLEKLYTARDTGSSLSFVDVVKGQEKHDVARTFSALLQLVNNGDVELERSGSGKESICYSAENPFCVNLLGRKKQIIDLMPRVSKKRANSLKVRTIHDNKHPPGKENVPVTIVSPSPPNSSCRFSVKIGKPGVTRCTPEGKKRRKSRFILRDETV